MSKRSAIGKLIEVLDRKERPAPPKTQSPIWLREARKWIGLREIPGPKHNAQILKWWGMIRSGWFKDDETPWCAGFVGGCLEASGIESTRSARARSYENWGVPLSFPAYGAVAVFWRGSPSSGSGHVAFVTGRTQSGRIICLGGNQSDAVNEKAFTPDRLVGYRWPQGVPLPKVAAAIHPDVGFDTSTRES